MKTVRYNKGGKLKVSQKTVSVDPPKDITGWKSVDATSDEG